MQELVFNEVRFRITLQTVDPEVKNKLDECEDQTPGDKSDNTSVKCRMGKHDDLPRNFS